MRHKPLSPDRRTPKLPERARDTTPGPRRILLRIAAVGTLLQGNWTLDLETSRHPALPVHLVVLRLPSRVSNPGRCLSHLGGNRYAITLRLEGAASPAEFASLSARTTAAAIRALAGPPARCPVTVAIHISRGRVSISIHESN